MHSIDNCIDGEQIQLSRMLSNCSVKKKRGTVSGKCPTKRQTQEFGSTRESEQRSELRGLRNLPTLPDVSTIDL